MREYKGHTLPGAVWLEASFEDGTYVSMWMGETSDCIWMDANGSHTVVGGRYGSPKDALEAFLFCLGRDSASFVCGCGSTEDVSFGPDPYYSEINDDWTPGLLCGPCYQEACWEI